MNILIVEDNAEDFLVIRDMLNADDAYNISRATNKVEALEIIQKQPGDFGLAIIDIRLDEGDSNNKDGLYVARKILNRKNAYPVVIVTNHYDVEEFTLDASNMGVNLRYFLNKDSIRRNPLIFQERIDDAIDNFGLNKISAQDYTFRQYRKVGIKTPNGAYQFYERNEILCLSTYENTKTKFMLANGNTHISSYNLGHFVPKIRSNFYNFIRLDQGLLINLETIKSVVGENLYFINDQQIHIGKTALARLRREHLMI